MQDLKALYDAVVKGDEITAAQVTQEALAAGIDPLKLVDEYMAPAMDEVGRLHEAEQYFLPEMFLSVRAMEESMKLIRPVLVAKGAEPAGRVVIGTVKGDQHDIGKNLVAALLEGAGFSVTDLGVDVPAEQFVATTKENNANIVAMSALLTTTMPHMKDTIEALKSAGLRDQVKVMIGGAPVTQRYADEVGADGYGDSAPAAVAVARSLAPARAKAPEAVAPAPPAPAEPVAAPPPPAKPVAEKKPAPKPAPAKAKAPKAVAAPPPPPKPVVKKKAAPKPTPAPRKAAAKKAPAKKKALARPAARKAKAKAPPKPKRAARKPAKAKARPKRTAARKRR
jgi:corrinoid protein of di/trimethylamine methyltransferase